MENHQKRNIKPFNGEKYTIWKFRVRTLLTEEPSVEWLRLNSIARSAVIEYLSDSFLNFAKDKINVQEMFESLDKIYERKSLATQLACRKRLSLKFESDMPLTTHFTNFEEIISELLVAGGKLEEMDKVSHLLITLKNIYDGVITALETLRPGFTMQV